LLLRHTRNIRGAAAWASIRIRSLTHKGFVSLFVVKNYHAAQRDALNQTLELLLIGLLVALIGASMGYLEAWAINPAATSG
jgi:glycerol uptake facilitator-like aquaporin